MSAGCKESCIDRNGEVGRIPEICLGQGGQMVPGIRAGVIGS